MQKIIAGAANKDSRQLTHHLLPLGKISLLLAANCKHLQNFHNINYLFVLFLIKSHYSKIANST
jgi:hypothetical protein